MSVIVREDIQTYSKLLAKYKYDFCRLVYIVFPFGEKGSELEHEKPYDWQLEEWARLSKHLQNPETRFTPFKLNVSSGNGAAKTSFMAMTYIMLTLTQRVRGRLTANTQDQLRSVTWPEFDVWFRRARYMNDFFEKLGEAILSRDEKLSKQWRLDVVTWDEKNPVAMSGLHNKGYCVFLGFDEAAGIPANIFEYASGAMSDVNTIKVWIVVGNSDDPNSKFEQNMQDPTWLHRRIDTRTMSHVDQTWVNQLLVNECGGDEDHDIFRVRVRGLPRKTAEGSIIKWEKVQEAFARPVGLGDVVVKRLPCIIGIDPAWQGGDETVISYRQGSYVRVLERFKLKNGMDHSYTYNRGVYWDKLLKADKVFIDQAEGTTLFTLAQLHNRQHWILVPFGALPIDQADPKDSEYANMRAMMYYRIRDFIDKGGSISVNDSAWKDETMKQLTWSKEERHKQTGKKKLQSKVEIKVLYGKSPDITDSIALCFADEVTERRDGHESVDNPETQTGPFIRDDSYNPDNIVDISYRDV